MAWETLKYCSLVDPDAIPDFLVLKLLNINRKELGEIAIILSLKISPSLSAVIKILFGFFVNSFFANLR
jgi:hypothetical protein